MNKVILMGRLVADPEVKYTTGEKQTAIARYRIAVNRKFKRDGEPEADFISCVAFGKAGEGFIRVSYAYSIEHIKEALERIEVFLNELNKNK